MLRPARSRRRPALAGEVAVVAFLLFGYDRVAALAAVRPEVASAHGRALLAVERSLGIDVERRLDLAVAAHRHLGQVLSVYYDFAHALVTLAVLTAVYLATARVYRPARTALLATNLVALVVFAAAPVAPPRLLPGGGFVDVVAGSGTWGSWEAASSGVAQHADVFASMPSLHVAWAVWVVLAVRAVTAGPACRGLAGVHLVVTVVVVVVTGNHYLVDVVAGAALSALSWAVTTSTAVASAADAGRCRPRVRESARRPSSRRWSGGAAAGSSGARGGPAAPGPPG